MHPCMGPEILSSTGAGVWRKAPKAFPDSSSVLDKFQSKIRDAPGQFKSGYIFRSHRGLLGGYSDRVLEDLHRF